MPARMQIALVDVVRAIRPGKARCARALVAVLERAALGPVSTWRRGAMVLSLAVIACKRKRGYERRSNIVHVTRSRYARATELCSRRVRVTP